MGIFVRNSDYQGVRCGIKPGNSEFDAAHQRKAASSDCVAGAAAFIRRFGSTLNAHLHFHC